MNVRVALAALICTPLLAVSPAFAQGDPEAGKILYNQKCANCHTLSSEPAHGASGPNLAGVVGRAAGSIAGWEFTPALHGAGLTWSEENLHKWLTDPEALVPGTKMLVKVPSKFEREDLIAYIKTVQPSTAAPKGQ
jgi:cytochrome c